MVKLSQKSSDFLSDAEQWMKKVEDIKHKSFKKIRLTSKPKPQNPELETLMIAKQKLRARIVGIMDPVLKSKLNENIYLIEREISTMCSEKMQKLLRIISEIYQTILDRFAN